jgi:hypothetical protein
MCNNADEIDFKEMSEQNARMYGSGEDKISRKFSNLNY